MTGPENRLQWTDVPDPVIRADEVLVRVCAAGLNRADLLQRSGNYPPPEGWPEWMGLEIAGVVEAVGDEALAQGPYRAGDRVCALLGGGGYAEYTAVPWHLLMPVPRGFTMEEAAGIPEVYATAYLNLFVEGRLQSGETLLVHAGASGVGIAATQIAKAAGARVIVTVRSADKAEKIRGYGADRIVNSSQEDVVRLFDDNAIDVVLDCVGGPQMGLCFARMKRFGRWILIATLGGKQTQIDLQAVLVKRLKLVGSTLRSRTTDEKSAVLSDLVQKIYPHFEKGAFRPVIHSVLPIQEAETAHGILARNENIGKVVLKVGEP